MTDLELITVEQIKNFDEYQMQVLRDFIALAGRAYNHGNPIVEWDVEDFVNAILDTL